jgi:hypothetical protein
MEKYKKVQEKTDVFIQFSDEELEELGWEKGQKLSLDFDEETKTITLKPFVKVEIDMGDWDRELLEFIIQESCEKDISVNEVISNILEKQLKRYEK